MDNPATTLTQFFSLKELPNERFSEITKSKEFSSIKKRISDELKGIPVPDGFFELMLKQLSDLLNIDIRAILVSAWSQSGEFLEYLNTEKYHPDETILLPLTEHTVTSEHFPILRPSINNITLGEIKFDINLELMLKGAVVKIQDGKIIEFTIGSCKGKGAVKHEDFAILEKATEQLIMPGLIELGEGIPIKNTIEEVHNIMDTITQNLSKSNE